jgi:hypothetical protein
MRHSSCRYPCEVPNSNSPWSAISLAPASPHPDLALTAGGEQPRTQWFKRMTEQEPHTADEMLRCEEVQGCPPRLKLSELEEGDELVSLCCMAACVGGWPDGRRAMA